MKYFFWILSLLMNGMLFASCDNDSDESVYSCNKTINSWVKENLPQIRKMTRTEWKELPVEVGSASYVAFTSEQKSTFWKEKIQEVKSLPWNQEELNHLEKLEDFIDKNSFIYESDNLTDEEADKLELFCYQWSKYAEEHLHWSKNVIHSILMTGYSPIDTKGNLETKKQRALKSSIVPGEITVGGGISIGFKRDCNCNIDCLMSCMGDLPCEQSVCENLLRGCGWLLCQSCDGRCGGM